MFCQMTITVLSRRRSFVVLRRAIIYYWHVEREIVLMLFLYRKSEQKDLTAEQQRVLAKAVQQEFK